MISLPAWPFGLMRPLRHGLSAFALVFASAAYGQSESDYAIVDGVAVYSAIMPAETLRGFPPGSDEARMHGGVPEGRHIHHLQIALFDASTYARITAATVTATLAQSDLAGTQLQLEPFLIGDKLTYGGYFEFARTGLYKIEVRAVLPGGGGPVDTIFEYQHR